MTEVIMYCTDTCPYCHRAEKLLKKKNVRLRKIRVDGNQSKLKEMIRLSGRNTVPQIFIGKKHIGGFDDLSELEIVGKLDKLLNS